jgi:hypothetical protein
MATAGLHRYRYRAQVALTLDDHLGLGPAALEAAMRAVLGTVPARIVAGRIDVHLDELERLDPDPNPNGGR